MRKSRHAAGRAFFITGIPSGYCLVLTGETGGKFLWLYPEAGDTILSKANV